MYSRHTCKVVSLINLDQIAICHQAERWAVLKDQHAAQRLDFSCTGVVVQCDQNPAADQSVSRVFDQIINCHEAGQRWLWCCEDHLQVFAPYYMPWKLWTIESPGNWALSIANWDFHPLPHQVGVGFLWFHRMIMMAAGQSGMLMKTLVGGSRPLARDPSVWICTTM